MATLPGSIREHEEEEESVSRAGDFSSLAKSMHYNLQVKLDNDNYIQWKAQVFPVIRAFQLEDYVLNQKSIPPKYVESESTEKGNKQHVLNKEFVAWTRSDQLLLSWLFSTIGQKVIGQVTDCLSSREIWSTLEELFSQQSLEKVLQLKHQLQNAKKGAGSVADFVLRIKTIGDSLKAAGQVISDNDLILTLLHGVGREYDSVVSVVTAQRNKVTLQEVQYLLLNHEQRIAQLESSTQIDVTSPSANFISGGQNDKRGQRGGFTSYNNEGRTGGGRGRNRGRGGSRWNNNRPICQVCGKTGHIASNCYHRFDRNFQTGNQSGGMSFNSQNQYRHQNTGFHNNGGMPQMNNTPQQANFLQSTAYYATPETVCDPAWYADSGATNHVTPELTNLSSYSEYQGGERLAVGSGQQLQISQVGNIHQGNFASREA